MKLYIFFEYQLVFEFWNFIWKCVYLLKQFEIQENVIFLEFKNWKHSILFCRAQNFACFDNKISPVAWKLWEFGCLEFVKLKFFRRAIFCKHSVQCNTLVLPFNSSPTPLHTSHSCNISHTHPLDVDIQLKQKKKKNWKFCLS